MAAVANYDGWSFLDDGSMVGPAGQAYDANLNQISDGSNGFFSGLGDFLSYAGKQGVDLYTAKMRTQNAISGQRYIEGQRLNDEMLRYRMQYGSGVGGIGIMPLLILGGVVVAGLFLARN